MLENPSQRWEQLTERPLEEDEDEDEARGRRKAEKKADRRIQNQRRPPPAKRIMRGELSRRWYSYSYSHSRGTHMVRPGAGPNDVVSSAPPEIVRWSHDGIQHHSSRERE